MARYHVLQDSKTDLGGWAAHAQLVVNTEGDSVDEARPLIRLAYSKDTSNRSVERIHLVIPEPDMPQYFADMVANRVVTKETAKAIAAAIVQAL